VNAQNPSKHSQSFTDRFERLYHHYYKRMMLTAFVVLQDTFEAQDAVNDAFVAMADAFDDLQKLDDVSAGAYMINKVRGCALALLKKRKAQSDTTVHLSQQIDTEMSCNRFLEQQDCQNYTDQVLDVIEHMHPFYRDVLKSHYMDGLTVEETAQKLGRRPDAVKHQLARGAKLLAREVQIQEGTYNAENDPQIRRHRYSKQERTKK